MFCRRVSAMFLLVASLALASLEAVAQQAPITRYARITGNVNFVVTGGSLRTEPNEDDACAVGSTSSANLSGVPVGATIRAAYLYWGGSGSSVDASVTLNSSTIVAGRTFTTTVPDPSRTFFGGFADITSRIGGNGALTFGGLTVDRGGNYCSSATVVAGWAVIVVYERSAEPLRAINIFDGLESFYGSAVTLNPNGFRIPATGINGKMAVVTWDGDPANSTSNGGFSESLRFNNTLLDDGIVVPGSNPTTQQYDGTINSLGIATSYGVDIDTYDVSSMLAPGQTSATTMYSSGGDRVFLTAQVVSVTSEPSVDLSIALSATGNFTVGGTASYSLIVSNAAGSQQTDFPIVVTDTLPAGLTYSSAIGAGWTCSASGQAVTCTHAGPLLANTSLPAITLNATVGNSAFPSVINTAQVTTPSNDPDAANNSASVTAVVLGSNLSTSTLSVIDLNGGDAMPGDTLRYTITLIESAGIAASAVSVTGTIAGNTSGFTVSSLPPGANNSSSGSGSGANGTGLLTVSSLHVPASGTVVIQFEVQVAAATPPGATIAQTISIDNPAGAGTSPSAPQVIVAASSIPGGGTKQLYLRGDLGQALHRMPPTTQQTPTGVSGGTQTWTLTPALQAPVTLAAGNMPLRLLLTRIGGSFFGSFDRTVSVTFRNSALGVISQINAITLDDVPNGSPSPYQITLNVPSQLTAPAGSTFSLSISYTASQNRGVNVWPYFGGDTSRLELNSLSVINVDSLTHYSAAYPAGAATIAFNRGSTVYVRTVVSDPFGSFDINGASVSLIDPTGAAVVTNVAMQFQADPSGATRIYEYAFTLPTNAPAGPWTTRVVAREGTENMVSDLGIGSFNVVTPALLIRKNAEVMSDPVNGALNPKHIPGSVVRYTITVTNTGEGAIDASTLAITDALPPNVDFCLAPSCGGGLNFEDGSVASGLTFTPATEVSYSSVLSGGAPFTYSPIATAQGYDPNIRGIRIAPSGAMSGATGSNFPSFTLRFFVRVR